MLYGQSIMLTSSTPETEVRESTSTPDSNFVEASDDHVTELEYDDDHFNDDSVLPQKSQIALLLENMCPVEQQVDRDVSPMEVDTDARQDSAIEKISPFGYEKSVSVDVDTTYTGPKLTVESTLTIDFVRELVTCLKAEQIPDIDTVTELIERGIGLLESLDSLVDLQLSDEFPLTICGDIHGQYYDMCNIFETNGEPGPERPYLFNGDMVDRGSFSTEVILTLISYKLLYPASMHMIRGNHETANISCFYGFKDEVLAKYNLDTYYKFCALFQYLPLSYCLKSSTGLQVLVMHGGLFDTDNITLDDIRNTDRACEPDDNEIVRDLLWADPQIAQGKEPNQRGTSIAFGPDVTAKFCEANNIEYIIRSHEVKANGFEEAHEGKCYTIFSAPNYCDTAGNYGAYIHLKGPDMIPDVRTFEEVSHPVGYKSRQAQPDLLGELAAMLVENHGDFSDDILGLPDLSGHDDDEEENEDDYLW